MQNQINCPQCHQPYAAEITQIIDVGQQPTLKRMLLSGRLNMAVCPHCNYGIQFNTPMLYHDPEHELFMVYVPMELNLSLPEQEKLTGDMIRQVMDNMPAEQRRGYMLQPLTIIKLQTFLEKVLETEGITPEMLDKQRQQVEFLQTLATAEKEEINNLLAERQELIDEAFFAMMESALQQVLETNDNQQIVQLTNLQAKLYQSTEVGHRVEKQKLALKRFQGEAQKQGGLSPDLVVKHILANEHEASVVEALGNMVQAGLNYHFFQRFSAEIEKREEAGDQEGVQRLSNYRDMLLKLQEEAQEESRKILQEANKVLQAILQAPDQQATVQEHLGQIDEAFMFLLNNTIAQAQEIGNSEQVERLRHVQNLIQVEIDRHFPPELRLINQLASTDDVTEQTQILNENADLLNDNLMDILQTLMDEARNTTDEQSIQHLERIVTLVRSKLPASL